MARTQIYPSLIPGSQNSPNIAINGGMEFWQRNTTFSSPANNVYTADRWKTDLAGTPTYTVSRETTIVDSGAASFKLDVTVVGGATTCRMVQVVENFAAYRGKTITVSARVRSNVASNVKVMIFDGTSSPVSTAHSGSGLFETLTVSLTMSATASTFSIYFGFISAVSVGTVYVDSYMVAIGSAPLPFTPTSPQIELAQCQRYFQKIGGSQATDWITVAQAFATTDAEGAYRFPVEMRTAPTMTTFGATGFTLRNATSGNIAVTALIFSNPSVQGTRLGISVAAGLVAGNATMFYSAATTSYFTAEAEM